MQLKCNGKASFQSHIKIEFTLLLHFKLWGKKYNTEVSPTSPFESGLFAISLIEPKRKTHSVRFSFLLISYKLSKNGLAIEFLDFI